MLRHFFLVTFLLTCISAFSQEILNHPKKMYVSPDGKLYIQKGLPVFLWLSTSPDINSNKQRLKSVMSANYTNPMYFDAEGFNSLRSPSAVDTTTKKTVYPLRDIVFEVYADSIAPVTKIDYGNATHYISEGKVHLGGNAQITLSANDGLSGLENIYYSLDGAPFKPYTAPISLSEEREYLLKYYSVDNVGNVEKLSEHHLISHKSSPVTKINIEGDKYENVLSGRSRIDLETDKSAAIPSKIYYSLDSGKLNTYISPIATALISQGEHIIQYYAMDKVGNQEEIHSYAFYVDKAPPTIIEEIVGNSFLSNGKEYSSGKAQLKLTSFDNKSGVKEVRYSINNSEYKLYEKPVFMTQTSGNLVIKSFAVDNVNNRSNSQTANDKTSIPYIDLTGPDLSNIYSGPEFRTRDTVFINSKTKIILKGSDSESGLSQIQYSLNGSDPKDYTGPFTVDRDGFNNIEYTGFDNVGNTSSKSFGFKIDNTGPEISYMFGTSSLRVDNGIAVYPSYTVLFLTATDKIVGFQHMTCSINNGIVQEYQGIIKNLPKGNNKIKIAAYDKLNNIQTLDLQFIIE
jgi:hypothetical protein